MTAPDFLSDASFYYADGWVAGRAQLMHELAARADCLDSTWQGVPRDSWEERVAERIAEMERAAAEWPSRAAEHAVRIALHDAEILKRAREISPTQSGVSLHRAGPKHYPPLRSVSGVGGA